MTVGTASLQSTFSLSPLSTPYLAKLSPLILLRIKTSIFQYPSFSVRHFTLQLSLTPAVKILGENFEY